MVNFLKSTNIAIAASGGLMFALALSGTAQAITDTIFMYSSPKRAYLGIPAAAFTPHNLSANYDGTGKSIQGDGCFSAPVNLPNDALLYALTVWYSSNAGWGSFSVGLIRNKLADGSDETILSETPPTTAGVYQPASFNIVAGKQLRTVNNPNYVYRVDMCLTGSSTIDPKFYSARITYTYTNAGD